MCGSISKRQRQSHQRDQEKQLLLASPTPSTPAPTPIRTTSPPPYSQVDRQTTPVDVGSYNLKRDKSSSTTGRPVSRILSPAFQAELCPPQIYAQPTECIANGHIRKRKYGTKGIIAGIVFFPWGLFW
ncbi:hypothetical protein CI109_100766 [Kwoniella shandongensis]|uniref:Uncharacterized protein n=1 Tax=Kwoniella shandongensis TaxID=1734106 RepID=A0AAJ8MSW6_9TREE